MNKKNKPLFDHPAVKRLAKDLLHKRLMIFLGAGASITVLPGGGRLAGEMAEDLERWCSIKVTKEERYDLMAVGKRYEQVMGRNALIRFVKNRIDGGEPSRVHQLVAEIGCRNIATTNYDTLQERAIASLGRSVKRIATIEDLVRSEGARVKVLKLHGSTDVPDTVGEGQGISKAKCAPWIITNDDYYQYYIVSQRPHPFESLLTAWLFTHQCLFVGYSLVDPNFQRIIQYLGRVLAEHEISREECYCAVMLGASEAKQAALREMGVEVINCDAGDFLDTLADRAAFEAIA